MRPRGRVDGGERRRRVDQQEVVGQVVSLDTVIRLASADDASADSSPDDETQTDYGLTVGNLPSALSGVKSVSPNATFEEAITVMALNRYDQLAVLAGSRTLRGAVTWESIAWARHANPDAPFSKAIIEAQEVRYDKDLVEVLPPSGTRATVMKGNHAGRARARPREHNTSHADAADGTPECHPGLPGPHLAEWRERGW